jgi:hypothetical protein
VPLKIGEMIRNLFFEGGYTQFRLVCQAKSDRKMLWLQLAGLKWGPERCKGVNTDTVRGA